MNKEPTTKPQVVILGGRDWAGIMAIAASIILAVFSAYSEHDRKISEVTAVQKLQGERIGRLEDKLDQLERDLRERDR